MTLYIDLSMEGICLVARLHDEDGKSLGQVSSLPIGRSTLIKVLTIAGREWLKMRGQSGEVVLRKDVEVEAEAKL